MGNERTFGNRCSKCGHSLAEPGDICGNCFGQWTHPANEAGKETQKRHDISGTKTIEGMVLPDGNRCPTCGAFLATPGETCGNCKTDIFPGTNVPPFPGDQISA